jgi:hypothetical protein
MSHERAEIEATINRYLDLRREAIAGDIPWTDLTEVFTEDAVFIDSVWGRHQGVAALVEFLDSSMKGLQSWDFPHFWQAIDGDRVFLRWSNLLPGTGRDGGELHVMGLSILEYAGNGKFSYEEDLYSESHLHDTMAKSTWKPSADMVAPPAERNWT